MVGCYDTVLQICLKAGSQEGTVGLLFICSENRLLSPTAESAFSAYPGIQSIGVGMGADTKTLVSWDLIKWADIVLVMEKSY